MKKERKARRRVPASDQEERKKEEEWHSTCASREDEKARRDVRHRPVSSPRIIAALRNPLSRFQSGRVDDSIEA